MEWIYLCFVIFLFALAVSDLWVGVSNDAVNFLNSAVGAKAAKFRTAIIVAALGRPGFVTEDMVADGAVIVDVGTTRVPDQSRKSGFRLCGDVDFEKVAPKCSRITPVPGGVGPMTIATLLQNTYKAALYRLTQRI